jgi:O-antigen/teichoic acid export membrane protein
VLFPLVLVIVTFAYEGLDQWLGRDFAENGGVVAQVLAVGVLIHSLTLIASAFVQSARPDLYAKLALLELPLYVLALWVLLKGYGIEGAAVAWTARVVVDGAALAAMARQLLPASAPLLRRMALPGAIAVLTLLAATQLEGPAVKAAFLAVSLPAFSVMAWLAVLDDGERLLVRARLTGARSR